MIHPSLTKILPPAHLPEWLKTSACSDLDSGPGGALFRLMDPQGQIFCLSDTPEGQCEHQIGSYCEALARHLLFARGIELMLLPGHPFPGRTFSYTQISLRDIRGIETCWFWKFSLGAPWSGIL